ncbi:MAG TPA: dienelactone hydrolase family protein, partial [Thermomicrobiales bacterium]|nr:dienelactone hydrolase family protein [Thermomicrobiales bacterium]
MCYSDDAHPPLPPVSGGAASEGDLALHSADGAAVMAYAARAAKPTGRGVVILPDVRGLHDFYKELATRFAEAGYDAVAIDYFGRTAGAGSRDEGFAYRPHVEQTTPAGVDADVAAAIAYLRSPEGGAVRQVFTVGFCFGGSNSWRQSASQPDLAGAIGLYGRPERVRDVVSAMKAP